MSFFDKCTSLFIEVVVPDHTEKVVTDRRSREQEISNRVTSEALIPECLVGKKQSGATAEQSL